MKRKTSKRNKKDIGLKVIATPLYLYLSLRKMVSSCLFKKCYESVGTYYHRRRLLNHLKKE